MEVLAVKSDLISKILVQLNAELQSLIALAEAARAEATHEESKAEDPYDTRGIEASYLAGAQAERATQLQRLISQFNSQELRAWAPNEAIEPGALVELDHQGKRFHYFLVAQGGGLSVRLAGNKLVQAIAVQAPLGEAIQGRKTGDWVEVEIQRGLREYQVISVV